MLNKIQLQQLQMSKSHSRKNSPTKTPAIQDSEQPSVSQISRKNTTLEPIIEKKKHLAAGIDPQVQSTLFEEIRAIPTGGYMRNSIVESIDKNEMFATMGKDQISSRIKKNFKGIFQDNIFTDEDNTKLPKLLQATQSPDGKGENRAPFDFRSPQVSAKFRATSLDTKVRIKKGFSGNVGSQTVKNGANIFKSNQDVIQTVYSTAQKKIRENIAKATIAAASHTHSRSNAAIHYQKMLFNRSNEFSLQGPQQMHTVHSNEKNFKSPAGNAAMMGTTTQADSGARITRGQTFNSIQPVSGLDESNNSTMLGTLAGAKNTKYKAQFRLNQNSQLNSKSISPLNVDTSKQFFPSKTNFIDEKSHDEEGSAARSSRGAPQGSASIPFPTRNLGIGGVTGAGGSFGNHTPGATQRALPQPTSAHQKMYATESAFDSKMDDLLELNSKIIDYKNPFAVSQGINIVQENINSVRDYKQTQHDGLKDQIAAIHHNLMAKKPVTSGSNVSLTKLQKLLHPRMKELFLQQQSASINHMQYFRDMNQLNGCFLDMVDSVCAYKIDLGIILQKLIESYNSIFLQQYECFYEGKIQKEKDLEAEIGKYHGMQNELKQEQETLVQKQEMCKHAIEVKDNEINRLLETQQHLEKQIKELQNIIRKDKSEEDLQQTEQDKKEAELDKDYMVKDYDKQKRIALKQNPGKTELLLDPKNVPEFKEVIQIVASRIDDRNEYVTRLYDVIKSMLTSKQNSIKTQTDQACMNNALMYDYYSYGSSSSDAGDTKQNIDEENSQDAKLKKLMKEKGIKIDETDDEMDKAIDTLKEATKINIKVESEDDNSEIDTVPDLNTGKSMRLNINESVSSIKSKNSKKNLNRVKSKNGSKLSTQGSKSRVGSKMTRGGKSKEQWSLLDAPITNHNLTMRQIGIQEPNKLNYLHESFDTQCMKVKKKKMLENNDDPTRMNKKEQWKIPYHIIAFIQNRIFELEDKPELLENYSLMPWFQFKEILFDVYDHRIKHAPELNGSANSNYCCLNEHLIMFYVDKYRKRSKAEEKIVDLLINIRYYYDFWQRAKIFAWNLELIYMPTDGALMKFKLKEQEDVEGETHDEYGDPKFFDQPHAYLKDQEVSESDIFTQEFFLHAYSLLCADREDFRESREGMTYVRVKHHDKVASKILPLIRGPCGDLQKWNLKIRRMVKRIKNKQGTEADYLDLDQIIGMMLEEFKNQRRLYQRDLQKQFMRQMESNTGAVDLDTYVEMVNSGLPPNTDGGGLENPLIVFPGKISQIRAYIYSCTCGDTNTNIINDDQFLAGCNRFAIENPVPSISVRCGLYGNNKDVLALLAEAEKRYGKANIKVDAKQFTSVTMGLPEKKEKKNDLYQKLMMGNVEATESDEDIDSKRKPTTEANETPRQVLSSTVFKSGPRNQKLEFVEHMKMKDASGSAKESEHVLAGGMKLKIQSIQKQMREAAIAEAIREAARLEEEGLKPDENMTAEEKQEYEKKQKKRQWAQAEKRILTEIQFGLSRKQIIVPSFETTAKIFHEHFLILRELRNKIDLLKQAYYGQMDKKKSWEQVDSIIKVLATGCKYLDFPIGSDLRDFLVSDQESPNSAGITSMLNQLNPQKIELGQKAPLSVDTGGPATNAMNLESIGEDQENEYSASLNATNKNVSQMGEEMDLAQIEGEINDQ